MDSSEATKMVFSRIQALDPENASKITGYVLIQDHGEQEMIRLAFGPDHLLHSLILNAKSHLGLSSNTSSSPSIPPFTPISIPTTRISRINAFHPSSPSSCSSPQWHNAPSFFSPNNTVPPSLPSYAAVVNGLSSANLAVSNSNSSNISSCSSTSPSTMQDDDIFDNKLNFFNGYGSIWGASEAINGGAQNFHFHRRSLSLSDACFPHHRFAAATSHHLRHGVSFPFSKCAHFETQRSAAAALMMGDEFQTFGRYKGERDDLASMIGMENPGSRQIYLTFPADSTFKEEDVSNYFSFYGPVQDVRIPYQQKRMFGFVTFVYAESVSRILSKGNPHFVCDSRVLVKPYKEKGKIPDKKQQPLERGDFSSSASGFDCSRIQEMMSRKLEEQQGIELEGNRLTNLHFLDLKDHHPIPTPYLQTQTHQNLIFPPRLQHQLSQEKCKTSTSGVEEEILKSEDCEENFNESKLPENLFGSPKKLGDEDKLSAFTEVVEEAPCSDSNTTTLLSPTSTLTMAPKTTPCSFLMPRLSSQIEM